MAHAKPGGRPGRWMSLVEEVETVPEPAGQCLECPKQADFAEGACEFIPCLNRIEWGLDSSA